MSKISNQLTELVNQKNQLAINLNVKGVSASQDETLNTLVPKVLTIASGDTRLGTKEITEDGTYYAYQDDLDGYSSVNVNILEDADSISTFLNTSGTTLYRKIKHFGNVPDYCYNARSDIKEIELIDCESIGNQGLRNCGQIEVLTQTIPLKTLSTYCLQGLNKCTSEILLDDSIEEIPNYSFNGSKLLKIRLPKNIKTIGTYAFQYVENILDEELPPVKLNTYSFGYATVKFKEIKRGTTLASYCFAYANGFTDLKIDTEGSIPSYSFQYSSIINLELGTEVTSIATNAFRSCSGLKTITCHTITPPTIYSTSFSSSNNIEAVYVPTSALETYKIATNWSKWADIMIGIEGE